MDEAADCIVVLFEAAVRLTMNVTGDRITVTMRLFSPTLPMHPTAREDFSCSNLTGRAAWKAFFRHPQVHSGVPTC